MASHVASQRSGTEVTKRPPRLADDIVCQAPEPEPKGSEPECKGGCQSQSQTVVAGGESLYEARLSGN